MTTRIREAMTTKDNQMQKPEDVIEPRSEYGNLPPELKAMQKVMDAVFGALNAAPQVVGAAMPDCLQTGEGDIAGAIAGTADTMVGIAGKECNLTHSAAAAPQFAPRRIDIENAIMRAPGFDYLLASEIFAAVRRRLELEYEDRLNTELADRMARLAKSFDYVTG